MTTEMYLIPECNLEYLELKLRKIANKCNKYGNDFGYQHGDIIYKNIAEPGMPEHMYPFHEIITYGTAIVNGWEYLASLEHTENGNLVTSRPDIEFDEKWFTLPAKCEHCDSKRYRKYTFLVRNVDTNEIKQVGKSCLKDYTNGLSAEHCAYISQFFNEPTDAYFFNKNIVKKYYHVEDVLSEAINLVEEFGYIRSDEYDSTKEKLQAIFFEDKIRSKYDTKKIESMIDWLLNSKEESSYIFNLQTIFKNRYCKLSQFGLIASLPSFMSNSIRIQKQKEQYEKALKEQQDNSEYFGSVGERINIVADVDTITSYEGYYGRTYIVSIKVDCYTFIWKTSKYCESGKYNVIGTIKEQSLYNGVKQTILTRCRLKETEDVC